MTDKHSAGEREIRSEINLHEAELRGQERGVKMAIANIKNRNLGVLSNDFESAVNAFEERIKRAERARGALDETKWWIEFGGYDVGELDLPDEELGEEACEMKHHLATLAEQVSEPNRHYFLQAEHGETCLRCGEGIRSYLHVRAGEPAPADVQAAMAAESADVLERIKKEAVEAQCITVEDAVRPWKEEVDGLRAKLADTQKDLERIKRAERAAGALQEALLYKPQQCLQDSHQKLRNPLCTPCQQVARWEEHIAELKIAEQAAIADGAHTNTHKLGFCIRYACGEKCRTNGLDAG